MTGSERGAFAGYTDCFRCRSRERFSWAPLDEDALKLVDQSKKTCVYGPGETVFYQGNACTGIHCVESGIVAVRRSCEQDEGPIIRLCEPGHLLGLREYLAEEGYSGTAQAITPCRLCHLDCATLGRLLETVPAVSGCFLQDLAQQLDQVERSLLNWRPMPVRARLASCLLMLRNQFGTGDDSGCITLKLPISRTDLAQMVGTRPETLSRAIRALAGSGVAEFDGRSVVVRDLDTLLDEIEAAESVHPSAPGQHHTFA